MGSGHKGAQNLGSDGVMVCGRLAALSGIICLAWYAVALMTTNWSYTDKLGDLDGVQIGYAEFGLVEWCFKTSIVGFTGTEHLVCSRYDETLNLYDSGALVSSKEGYDRFDGLRERIGVVYFGVITALLACFIGAVFSEKPVFNSVCLTISAIAGCIAMSAWLNFQEELNTDDEMMVGTAGGLVIGAWMLSAAGAVLACVDRYYTSAENRTGLFDDGISVGGRFASAGTIVVWLLFGLAINSPEWSTTSDLGPAGGICNRTAATCGDASFGLWKYQIQAKALVINNGTEFVDVVLDWDEKINTNGVDADGNKRFDDYGAEIKRQVAGGCVVIAIFLAILADLFNEKLMFACSMMWLVVLAGMIAMSSWVNFQEELSEDTGSKMEFAEGGWMEVVAWIVAMVSGCFLCINARRTYRSGGGGSAAPGVDGANVTSV